MRPRARKKAGTRRQPAPVPQRIRLARARSLSLALALVLAGGWAYATSFTGAFVFDDFISIVNNPNIRSLEPLEQAFSAPPDTTLSGRPVASLSFAINYALAPPDAREVFEPGDPAGRFARNVWGYHAINTAIHLAAALLLFAIVRRTLSSDRLRSRIGGATDALAFAIALLWCLHPLHTESVTYIVQRVESLMGLFALLAIYCAARATTSARPRVWMAATVAAYALALGSKESAVVVPLVILAWDFVFLDDAAWWRRRWVLYAALAAVTPLLVFTASGARTRSVGLWLEGWTPWTYLLTQVRVIVHYLRLSIWPAPLVLDPYWPMVRSPGEVIWPLAVLVAVAVLTMIGVARRRPAGFAGAWFFLWLAPTSSVLPIVTEVAAEHRMYLPLAAITAVVFVGSYLGIQRVIRRAPAITPRAATMTGMAVVGIVAVTLGLVTRDRNRDYASDERIWRDTIRKQPQNPRARSALGANLVLAGRYQEAEAELQSALALDPESPVIVANLGAAEIGVGKLDAGIAHLERAIALRPEYAVARRNLADAYLSRRQDFLAAAQYRWCLEARPDDPVVLKKLGLLLAVSSHDEVRDGTTAVRLTERAVQQTSRRDAAALTAYAAALAEVDRFDDAVRVVREALALTSAGSPLARELSRLLGAYTARQKIRRPA